MPYDVKTIGQRIFSRRKELGYTLDDIAASVNVAKSTIQRYETGSIKRPKLPVINSIAQALRVSPDWLMGFDVPMEIIGEATVPADGSLSQQDIDRLMRSITDRDTLIHIMESALKRQRELGDK